MVGRGARRGAGANITQWKVTLQGSRARKAHCLRCKLEFEEGELRVQAARPGAAKNADRIMHLHCVDPTLPEPDAFTGYEELNSKK